MDNSAGFTGAISNFGAGNQIDLAAIAFSANTQVNFAANQQGGTLTVTDGTHTANITVVGQNTAHGFHIDDDHHNGTVLTYHT